MAAVPTSCLSLPQSQKAGIHRGHWRVNRRIWQGKNFYPAGVCNSTFKLMHSSWTLGPAANSASSREISTLPQQVPARLVSPASIPHRRQDEDEVCLTYIRPRHWWVASFRRQCGNSEQRRSWRRGIRNEAHREFQLAWCGKHRGRQTTSDVIMQNLWNGSNKHIQCTWH